MTEKQEPPEVVELKIRGVVTEPKCWAARYFAEFAIHTAPTRYMMDIKFLYELEWTHMKRKLTGQNVKVPGMGEPLCAVWANGEYIGDDVGLCKFLKKDGFINHNLIYSVLDVSVQISKDPLDHCPRDLNRAYVYFNVIVDGRDIGRMLFELFTDKMPLSCERFLKECQRYEGSAVHRIAHGGWFESGRFEEEDHPIREKRPSGLSNCREGMLSLVNAGRTNCKSSTFLVTFVPATHLDPYQCPIGALIDGKHVLRAIDDIETYYDSPLQKINIKNITIYYSPQDIVKRNHLICIKATDKPATVWLKEGKLKRKPDDEEVKKYRFNLNVDYRPLTTDLDEQLIDIRRQLLQENKKLKQILDQPRLKKIIESLIDVEKTGRKELDIEDMKKIKGEKWFKMLLNADSDFELYYKPGDVPQIYPKETDEWLQRSAIIENPTIIRLLQYVKKRDLGIVTNLIERLIEQAIDLAMHEKGHELYVQPADKTDYSRPLGDDLEKLPQSMHDMLVNEVCQLSNTAFDLFRQTLRHIIETVSEVKLDEIPSVSADVLTVIAITKSVLGVCSLSKFEIVKRQESLVEDVKILTKSMISIHERSKSEPLKTTPDLYAKERASRITV